MVNPFWELNKQLMLKYEQLHKFVIGLGNKLQEFCMIIGTSIPPDCLTRVRQVQLQVGETLLFFLIIEMK